MPTSTPTVNRLSCAAAGALLCVLIPTGAAALVLGVDVSRWQYDINWGTFTSRNQIDFAFIKYTDSETLIDDKAVRNTGFATQYGVPYGVYHFATPFAQTRNDPQNYNDNDAAAEAAWFVSQAGAHMGPGHLPPVLDIEFGEAAGRTRLTNWARTFLDTVEDLSGVRPIIYANQYWASTFLTASALDTGLWIARWTEDPNAGPTNLGGWDDYLFHQYTASLTMRGVTGNTVDGNVFNGTLSDLNNLVNPVVIPEPAAVVFLLSAAALLRRRGSSAVAA